MDKATQDRLLDAMAQLIVRLHAQEAIMVPVARKLGITKAEAFAALDLTAMSDVAEYLPEIRQSILRTLNHHR